MKQIKTIIVVEDNKSVRSAITLLLQTIAERIVPISSPVTLPNLISTEKPSCLILDMNFSSGLPTAMKVCSGLRRYTKFLRDFQLSL